MNKFLAAIFATALGFGFAQPTLAHEGMGDHCKMHSKKNFEKADADHDGTLDREEAKAFQDHDFDTLDADHDGTLTKEELNNCMRKKHDKKSEAMHEKRSKEFSSADTDNDGTLTRDEAKKLPRVFKNFDAIDTDKDGTLDRDEVHEFMHSHKSK